MGSIAGRSSGDIPRTRSSVGLGFQTWQFNKNSSPVNLSAAVSPAPRGYIMVIKANLISVQCPGLCDRTGVTKPWLPGRGLVIG